jgi:hypothetical protein
MTMMLGLNKMENVSSSKFECGDLKFVFLADYFLGLLFDPDDGGSKVL